MARSTFFFACVCESNFSNSRKAMAAKTVPAQVRKSFAVKEPWAGHCQAAMHEGKTVYAYFNNDWNCRAPENAKTLMEMTELVPA